jgi:hypothetical protein
LHNNWLLRLTDGAETTASVKPLLKIVGNLSGMIAGNIRWIEAVQIKLEFRFDRLWLVFLPTIYFISKPKGEERFVAAEFSRQRQATRYNGDWQNLIDAWMRILTNNCQETEIKSFGISDGCDAGFTIGTATAFCYKEGPSAK